MSTTPRTDHFASSLRGLGVGYYQALDLARELETELAALRSETDETICGLNAKLDTLQRSVLDLSHPNIKMVLDSRAQWQAVAGGQHHTLQFIHDECDWEEGRMGCMVAGDNRIGPACVKALAAYTTLKGETK